MSTKSTKASLIQAADELLAAAAPKKRAARKKAAPAEGGSDQPAAAKPAAAKRGRKPKAEVKAAPRQLLYKPAVSVAGARLKKPSSISRRSEAETESEVTSRQIGEIVMDTLKDVDEVAYVRFASVYKNFREAKDFEDFVGKLGGFSDKD